MNKIKNLLTILTVVGFILVGICSAGAGVLWVTGSPDGDFDDGASGPGPVVFKLDTSTGIVGSVAFSFETFNWMWISGFADSGKYLYASHNTYRTVPGNYLDAYDFKIAKINRFTGAVLSDTSIASFLGQTLSQVNALEFHDGRLYAIENATSGSTIRGYALEILLDAAGDVVGAAIGQYLGLAPDGGLDYYDGLWYATTWGYTPIPKKQGSILYTTPDLMTVPFTKVGTGNSAVQGIGMIDGLEFTSSGLFALSWYDPAPPTGPLFVSPSAGDWIATEIFSIDLSTRKATFLYDLSSQLPPTITWLSGLSEVNVPVATAKSACKNDGWQTLSRTNDTPFKNQGDCIQYVNTGK